MASSFIIRQMTLVLNFRQLTYILHFKGASVLKKSDQAA